jgi:hypothetical protein
MASLRLLPLVRRYDYYKHLLRFDHVNVAMGEAGRVTQGP